MCTLRAGVGVYQGRVLLSPLGWSWGKSGPGPLVPLELGEIRAGSSCTPLFISVSTVLVDAPLHREAKDVWYEPDRPIVYRVSVYLLNLDCHIPPSHAMISNFSYCPLLAAAMNGRASKGSLTHYARRRELGA